MVGGFMDHGSKKLGCEAVSGEQPTHRISVGVLSCLPLAPGVATLILVHFIRELRVTRVRLSQQAVGKGRVTKGEVVANTPSSARWSGNIYTGSLLTLPLGFSTSNSSSC